MASKVRVTQIEDLRPPLEATNPFIPAPVDFPKDQSFPRAFQETVKASPDNVIIVTNEGKEITRQQWWDMSRSVAKSLLHVGLKRFDGVNIMGFNSIEWFATDVGGIMAGGVVSGIYTTNNAETCEYILHHSRTCAVFVEGKNNLEKIYKLKSKVPYLKAIVCWNVQKSDYPQGASETDIYSFEEFLKLGVDVADSTLDEIIASQTGDQCCSIVYTSGTTGMPKAAMISHDNTVWTAKIMGPAAHVSEDDVLVSFLPLSHVAANMIDIKGCAIFGFKIYLASPDALKGALVNTLVKARPTIFLGVPRVWEKMHEKMAETGQKASAPLRWLASWAKGVGTAAMEAEDNGTSRPFSFAIAKPLVFDTIKAKLGFDRCRLFVTSGAPICEPTLAYFRSIYIRISDLYGASEATGPITMNRPWNFEYNTAGQALEGTEVVILNKDANGEGEIAVRGRNVFMGYLGNEKATEETIDEQGFLHTGDMGKIDERGFLRITGRFKELIITGGGENVAPVPIETEMMNDLGALSRIVVIGDQKKFLSCLIVLKVEERDHTKLAGVALTVDPNAKTVAEAKASSVWKEYLEKGIKEANKKAISNAAFVQKYTILDEDLSIENGELTPTLKVKRSVVHKKFAPIIDAMYDQKE
eukprot:CAMPEP_0184696290 /NCGR_PEP_ID=MMETSP0313-20130426/3634_1 /TAXON_ID=2792 /ORGANISM="Porphyridium aerugineum, Strain SAG 1380-2" /LENGTH=641 /DNA_ID=CAMNT_0027154889 /DNA_START=531 /DNA_END=2456 /DNA_ORIENTATION=+